MVLFIKMLYGFFAVSTIIVGVYYFVINIYAVYLAFQEFFRNIIRESKT